MNSGRYVTPEQVTLVRETVGTKNVVILTFESKKAYREIQKLRAAIESYGLILQFRLASQAWMDPQDWAFWAERPPYTPPRRQKPLNVKILSLKLTIVILERTVRLLEVSNQLLRG